MRPSSVLSRIRGAYPSSGVESRCGIRVHRLLILLCFACIPGLASQLIFHIHREIDLTQEIFNTLPEQCVLPSFDPADKIQEPSLPDPSRPVPWRVADFALSLLPTPSRRLVTVKARNGAPLSAKLVLPYIRPVGSRPPPPTLLTMLKDLRDEPDVVVMFLSGGCLLLIALGGALDRSSPPRAPYTVPPVPGRPEKIAAPPLLPSLTRAPF